MDKVCSKCSKSKDASEFYKDATRRDGLYNYCKECHKSMIANWQRKNPEKTRAATKAWREAHPEKAKQSSRKSTAHRWHGISAEEYAERIGDGRCAICNEVQETPCLDHCHQSGKLRGVLCRRCNSGLGFFRDNPEYLASAIEYLKQHN